MGRAVFADADRVVRENVDVRQFRERGEPNRGAAIIGENKKGRAGGAKNAVIRNAVHDRAHAVFANSEMDVAAVRIVAGEILAVLDVIQGRAVKIGAAADEKRHRLRERLQGFAPGFAGREFRVRREIPESSIEDRPALFFRSRRRAFSLARDSSFRQSL